MREINTSKITDVIQELCIKANKQLPADIEKCLHRCAGCETNVLGKSVLCDLEKNLVAAKELDIPICQDTGMAVVFLEIGQDVHSTGGQSNQSSQGGALHAQSIIQRQQGGDADQEGDSAGTVQMDDHGQDSGTDADLDGIGANQLQHLADDGTEGTGIGQNAEEQDGEDEHNAGSGNGADTAGAGDHAAQALEVGDEINHAFSGAFGNLLDEEAGDDAGDHGNSDQGNQGRGLLGHDQHQHGDDRYEAEYCERNRHNDFLLIFFGAKNACNHSLQLCVRRLRR